MWSSRAFSVVAERVGFRVLDKCFGHFLRYAVVGLMIVLKYLHDYVKARNEELVERYIDIAGRVTALVVGTFAIEMIMRGLAAWRVTSFPM